MFMTRLDLETVTPMFLYGYQKLELRPPPFKSLMRYWWRTVQDSEESRLRKAEAKLFGSTEGKAPFSMRITGTTNLKQITYRPLPHSTTKRFKKDAYKGGQSFTLNLITANESEASTYAQIAKLGFLLGGLGNRSRRGFGSIRKQDWNFKDISHLQQVILHTLNAVADVNPNRFQMNGQIIKSTLTDFPNYPVIQSIYFGKSTDNPDSLLKKVGQATHDHSDDALGYAKRTKRLASPLHVRIQKIGSAYLPLVTHLYCPELNAKQPWPKQKQFIQAVIK